MRAALAARLSWRPSARVGVREFALWQRRVQRWVARANGMANAACAAAALCCRSGPWLSGSHGRSLAPLPAFIGCALDEAAAQHERQAAARLVLI